MSLLLLPFLLVSSASAASVRGSSSKNNDTVQAEERSLSIEGACSGASLLPALSSNNDFKSILQSLGSSNSELESALDEICNSNHNSLHRKLQDESPVSFSDVTKRGYQFDKNYFDGGTSWNDGMYSISKEIDAGRIDQVVSTLQQKQLAWPEIVNFEQCDLQTVMCCFTEEQDSTSLPSTNSPIASGNADVCHHNMANSKRASHTANGLTIYTSGRNVFEHSNDAYCTAFTWDQEDANSLQTLYKANTLFHISMYDGFYKNNRVGSVPGAPMCGCIEQMPTVSNSACVKPVESTTVTATRGRKLQVETKVDFVKCNEEDDFVAHYETTHSGDTEAIAKVKKTIVGDNQCPVAVDNFLVSRSYKRGEAFWYVSHDDWAPLAGQNFLYYPSFGKTVFNELYEASSTKIIRRVCKTCKPSHRDIFYRRKTDATLPEDMDLLNYFKNSWSNVNNVMGEDFELYSTYEDAVSRTNPWTFCNYSTNYGFPYECGPTAKTTKQWTSFKSTSTYARSMAFYMDKN